jgi:methyl-accepting chemotaxis protein
MPRLHSELDLVVSIKSLAMQTTTLAVDSIIEAGRADLSGNRAAAAELIRRLAIGTGLAAGEMTRLAAELDASTAGEDLIAAAGAAITGLQSSLLSIAGAVHEIADAGGPAEIFASAEALRTTALRLDELLPSFQPATLGIPARRRTPAPVPKEEVPAPAH